MKMIAYLGFKRTTEIEVEPIDLGCGAGEVACFECGGDGNWGKFAPEIVGADCPCVECKGTGRVLVSI
jgi:hypothetical protein